MFVRLNKRRQEDQPTGNTQETVKKIYIEVTRTVEIDKKTNRWEFERWMMKNKQNSLHMKIIS